MSGIFLDNVRVPLNLRENDIMPDGLNSRFIPLLRVGAFLPRMRIDTIPYITLILLFSFHDIPLTHLYSYPYTIPNATRVPSWAYLSVVVCFVSA